MPELDLDRTVPVKRPVRPQEIETSQRHRRERLPGNRRTGVSPAWIEVVELAPPPQRQRPRCDRLEYSGLPGIVGTGQHDMTRKVKFHFPSETLETADSDRVYHLAASDRGLTTISSSPWSSTTFLITYKARSRTRASREHVSWEFSQQGCCADAQGTGACAEPGPVRYKGGRAGRAGRPGTGACVPVWEFGPGRDRRFDAGGAAFGRDPVCKSERLAAVSPSATMGTS